MILNFPCTGAMLVICDVNEYRKCVKEFGVPIVSQLFEKLHALCNLLAVVPENLKEVCGGEQLVCWTVVNFEYEPVHEKTNNLGFRPGQTLTRLYSHSIKLEAGNFVYK